MSWSESVTIYLAAGASFGVHRYLCVASAKNKGRSVVEGLAAALIWPLVAAAILTKSLRRTPEESATKEMDERVRARIEDARRAFVASVNKMLEAVRASRPVKSETVHQALYALREAVEQYAGLAQMEAELDEHALPVGHEMELARISGRRGDDLLVAGRCVHRRNVSRIKAHYERERSRLLRKLSELRAEEENSLSSNPDDSCRAERLKLSEARLEIYMRAADLFSLLEDERAARSAARLTDAECSYLRRMREMNGEPEQERSPGEERCTKHAPHLIYKDPLRATTFTQG